MYCQHCGAQVNDDAVVCIKCGRSIEQKSPISYDYYSISAGLVILAVLFPIFGIIYWPVKAKTRPRCARACGIAAIISWVASALIQLFSSGLL